MSDSNPFTNWLHRGKDAASSLVARRALAEWFNRYGRMLDFKIDSRRKVIELEVLPRGETQPIRLVLEQYELVSEAGGTFIIIHRANASREWLTFVLEDFICGRRFPVPEKYAAALRLLA